MDSLVRDRILKIFTYRRYQARLAEGLSGDERDDNKYAVIKLACEIQKYGEDFVEKAYGIDDNQSKGLGRYNRSLV